MLRELENKRNRQKKRKLRVRKHLKGTAERPRLCVSKTNKSIYVQIIDDANGITIAGLSTFSKKQSSKTKQSAKTLGEKLAAIAKEKNIQTVLFDRGKFKFHGVVAEFANAVRSGGIQF